MAEPKFKHQIIVEVTFDEAILEGDAVRLFREGMDVAKVNQLINEFFAFRQPQVRNIVVKRLSRVLGYLNRKE